MPALTVFPIGCHSGGKETLTLRELTESSTVRDFVDAYREKTGICACLYKLQVLGGSPSKAPGDATEGGEATSADGDAASSRDRFYAQPLLNLGVAFDAGEEAPTKPAAGSLIVSGLVCFNYSIA
eukprot:TRINITY_DN25296_c0_g1_i1.p1 TRINITY_DN25296_c0_g1~~TRINITY_DN25296_c0_g1_i1.p1  ORF type:complete len:125 (-),score=18.01 TRINITY_DN25296_c0_g1_i1:268-642(-)